jgi:hypothetical protein
VHFHAERRHRTGFAPGPRPTSLAELVELWHRMSWKERWRRRHEIDELIRQANIVFADVVRQTLGPVVRAIGELGAAVVPAAEAASREPAPPNQMGSTREVVRDERAFLRAPGGVDELRGTRPVPVLVAVAPPPRSKQPFRRLVVRRRGGFGVMVTLVWIYIQAEETLYGVAAIRPHVQGRRAPVPDETQGPHRRSMSHSHSIDRSAPSHTTWFHGRMRQCGSDCSSLRHVHSDTSDSHFRAP